MLGGGATQVLAASQLDYLRELAVLRRQVETSAARDALLRADLEKAVRDSAALASSYRAAQDELARLRDQAHHAGNVSAQEIAETAGLRVECERLREDNRTTTSSLQVEIEKERTRLGGSVDRHQRRALQEEAARRAAEEQVSEGKRDVEEKVDALTRQLNALRTEVRAAKDAQRAAERARDAADLRLSTELARVSDERAAREERLRQEVEQQFEHRVKALAEDAKSAQEQAVAAHDRTAARDTARAGELEATRARLADAQEEVRVLREQQGDMIAERGQLRAEVTALTAKAELSGSAARAAELSLAVLERRIEDLHRQHEDALAARTASLQRGEARHSQEVARLQELLAQRDEEADLLARTVRANKEQVSAASGSRLALVRSSGPLLTPCFPSLRPTLVTLRLPLPPGSPARSLSSPRRLLLVADPVSQAGSLRAHPLRH